MTSNYVPILLQTHNNFGFFGPKLTPRQPKLALRKFDNFGFMLSISIKLAKYQ